MAATNRVVAAGSLTIGRRIAYELQNVGEITNRGWEISGSIGTHGLSVSTAYAIVDSRVRRLADRYTGDLRPGDRLLEVPERTMSATASYARGPWSASVTGSRAFDWVNYDRLALANAVESGDRPPRDLIGEQLRSFWRLYPGVNRLRATLLLRPAARVVTGGDRRQSFGSSVRRTRQRHGPSGPDYRRWVEREVLILPGSRTSEMVRKAKDSRTEESTRCQQIGHSRPRTCPRSPRARQSSSELVRRPRTPRRWSVPLGSIHSPFASSTTSSTAKRCPSCTATSRAYATNCARWPRRGSPIARRAPGHA